MLGVVLRHIGRPRVRSSRLPLTGVLGLGWSTAPGLKLAAEVLAADRLDASGYDLAYRAGVHVSTGRRLPISAIVAFQLDKDFELGAWSVGISVGGDRRAVAMGTVRRIDGASNLNLISVTGVALNRNGLGGGTQQR